MLLARQDDHSIRGYDTMDLNGKTIGVVERAEENIRRLEAFCFSMESNIPSNVMLQRGIGARTNRCRFVRW